jgi:hypothetical protein
MTWINSHLKKRPGCALVTDLQRDLASGLALAHLIEIISGSSLTSEVNMHARSPSEYKDNVECILRFMHSNAIKMHQTTAREIVDGNLKSIMRLVLALAAHFKPSNVQPYKVVADAMANRQQRAAPGHAAQWASLDSNAAANTNSNQNVNSANKRSSSTNNVHHTTNGTYVVANSTEHGNCFSNQQYDRAHQSKFCLRIIILEKKCGLYIPVIQKSWQIIGEMKFSTFFSLQSILHTFRVLKLNSFCLCVSCDFKM